MIRRSIFWVVGFALSCQGQIALGWQEFMAGLGQERAGAIRVEALAALPDSLGVAGPFCGVVNQSLIVAGGANFPAGMPWEGGTKVWHTAIYRLDEPQGTWEQVGELPRPLGYGVSISIPEGLLLIGGSDANQHFANVMLLQINDGRCVFRELRPLPIPLANSSGVLAGNHVFVVGGSDQPGEQSASSRVFSLDLGPSTNRTLDAEWAEQRSLPGRGRIFPGIACLDDELFVFGGATIEMLMGAPRRSYLVSGIRGKLTGSGDKSIADWRPMADMPMQLVATPTPSPAIGLDHFLVFGGDDGSQRHLSSQTEHPGFNGTCLTYHRLTDTWAKRGSLESPSVTTNIVPWRGSWVIPSGELRPGVRTPAVTAVRFESSAPQFGVLNYLTLMVYLFVVFGVGLLAAGKIVNTNQFFRADQSIPWWAAGLGRRVWWLVLFSGCRKSPCTGIMARHEVLVATRRSDHRLPDGLAIDRESPVRPLASDGARLEFPAFC